MGKIGIFDSGFGGLTIMKAIQSKLPDYDYVYLGDNLRAPYGNKSFDTVYQYTWECVQWLIQQDCKLIILACNTASARALRNIQQKHIINIQDKVRVLGVIRPTAEVIGTFTASKEIGILATEGTVKSGTYPIEIEHFFPEIQVYQQACPLWVPIIEADYADDEAVEKIVRKDINTLLNAGRNIDTILLGCTHYPLLLPTIHKVLSNSTLRIINQATIVADSLVDYLKRHPEINMQLLTSGHTSFFTTDMVEDFEMKASKFYGSKISAQKAAF